MERHGSRLSRRDFVGVVGAVGLGLVVGCGRLPFQQPPPTAVKVHRLGFLNGTNPAATAQVLNVFRQALGELGYVEGQNLAIEYRWGDGSEAGLVEPTAELARLPVDVFVVPSTGLARIVSEATSTIPIVLITSVDPVAAGLAASYARPAGNVTGVTNLASGLNGKCLQLLKEAVPSISRVAVLWDTETIGPFPLERWSRDAQAVGVQVHRWSRAARRSLTPRSMPRRGKAPMRWSSLRAFCPMHIGRSSPFSPHGIAGLRCTTGASSWMMAA